MAVDGIFVIVIVSWAAMFMGLWMEDKTLASLVSMALMVIGIGILINGFDAVNDLTTSAFGLLNTGFGFYVLIKSNIDKIQEIF